jgi:hypothetical protein
VLGSHPQLFHDGVSRGGDAEAVDAEDFAFGADVFPPEGADAGFDGDAVGAGFGEDALAVVGSFVT